MKRKLKVNDFFCGCGGMGIAFKNAGYEIAGAWDFDKYAVESYRDSTPTPTGCSPCPARRSRAWRTGRG